MDKAVDSVDLEFCAHQKVSFKNQNAAYTNFRWIRKYLWFIQFTLHSSINYLATWWTSSSDYDMDVWVRNITIALECNPYIKCYIWNERKKKKTELKKIKKNKQKNFNIYFFYFLFNRKNNSYPYLYFSPFFFLNQTYSKQTKISLVCDDKTHSKKHAT